MKFQTIILLLIGTATALVRQDILTNNPPPPRYIKYSSSLTNPFPAESSEVRRLFAN
ncbi:hypothetical protein Vi05172_g6324 [Venturia inaequalis]|nr:hypothetical protein Vi05172_g6324 [Venturia inaequalis]